MKRDIDIKDYKANGGCACPDRNCGSNNIEGVSMTDIDCNVATQELQCNDCGLVWEDVYEFKTLQVKEV